MNIDDTARAAARDVRERVTDKVQPALALHEITAGGPPRRHRRGRALAVAAAVVVLAGGVVFAVEHRGADKGTTVEFVPTAPHIDRLPAKPTDGINSLRLPVTADPATGLTENAAVTVTGTGFLPDEQVAVVECVATPDGARNGPEGCDLASLTYGFTDADGSATVQVRIRRIITTARDGTVDCAIAIKKCSLGMGSITDYNRSGGVAVDFDASEPAPNEPTIAVTPADALGDGEEVTVTGNGLTGAVTVYQCRADTSGQRSDCEKIGTATADGSGHISTTAAVKRLLGTTPDTYPVDCASYPGACVVVAEGTDQTVSRGAALTFDDSVDVGLPTLTFLPAGEGLHDGQVVQLEGSSFTPGASISIGECGFGATGQSPCVEFAPVTVDEAGHFAASFQVSCVLGVGPAAFDCATDGECQISAVPSAGFAAPDIVISFAS